jgi:hypothetical protein
LPSSGEVHWATEALSVLDGLRLDAEGVYNKVCMALSNVARDCISPTEGSGAGTCSSKRLVWQYRTSLALAEATWTFGTCSVRDVNMSRVVQTTSPNSEK